MERAHKHQHRSWITLGLETQPLLRWHRDLFRWHWRRKSESIPHISTETIALIKRMVNENRLWGAERIRGELLKLGIKISKRTIQKYTRTQRRHRLGQTWTTFLKGHMDDIWACDFTVVYDLLFRPIHIFVIMELHTRRIIHAALTRTPTDAWAAQQLREATPWGKKPKYLIRDRDSKYGKQFAAAASGIQILKTPVRAPKANAFCERFMGSLKRECLDHRFVVNCGQLSRLVQQYIAYYNKSRPHQGLKQQIPDHSVRGSDPWPVGQPGGEIVATPVLGGLHHSYVRVAVSSR